MGFPKPSGKYADQMTGSGGWPFPDEQEFLNRAIALADPLRKVTKSLESWLREQTEVTAGSMWSGSGANAAGAAIQKTIEELTQQQADLVKAIAWLNNLFSLILNTKLSIFERVVTAEAEISALESANLRPEVRQTRIDEIVAAARDANVGDVAEAARMANFSNFTQPDQDIKRTIDAALRGAPPPTESTQATGNSLPPTSAPSPGGNTPPNQPQPLQTFRNDGRGLTQERAPQPATTASPPEPMATPANSPTTTTPEAPSANPQPAPGQAPPPNATPVSNNPANTTPSRPQNPQNPFTPVGPNAPRAPATPGVSSPGQPASPISTGGAASSPGTVPSIGGSQGPSTGTGGGGPQAPAATAGPGQGSGPAPVSTPQQDFQKGFSDATKAANANPMPLNQTPLGPAAPAAQPVAPVYQQADATSPTAPAAATTPSTPVTSAPTPSAPPAPAAPTGAPPMPLGNPSTPAPAAPVSPGAGPVGPAVAPASTNQGAAGGAAAPVPISAARAERDAIANAATAGALRRKGPTPRQHARHIAAALNVDITDPSLFWITATTSDGQILTANNYGLAYIPEHVHLPEQVRMVTADETIPAQTRGTWATYPLLAVQEWARHHDVTLQAVAGTEENLKGFDLGAARDIITAEDMPASGKMQGRNRLEVIAPEVATKLAGISASGLTELLPPAPADNTPPADNRINLLLEVCKPLLSANPDRAGAHLKAMVAYADHLQDVALFRAHTAQDAELQRAAIAEWIYWQHISVLSTDALAAMVS